MTPEQFGYWLQGAFETADEGRGLSKFDHIIRDHLEQVFYKKTQDYSVTTSIPNGQTGTWPTPNVTC